MTDGGKGGALAVATAMLTAVFLIPYKAAGDIAVRDAVVPAMLLAAAVLNTALTLARRRQVQVGFDRVSLGTAAALAVFTVTGNVAVSEALVYLDPGLTSVALQTQVLIVAVVAHFVLGERLTAPYIGGALLALVGFAIMRMPAAGHAVPAVGIALGLTGAASYGLMHIVTRRVIHRIDPVWVNALRLWMAVVGLLCLPGRASALVDMAPRPWLLATAAAVAGPFLGRVCIMYAVRYIEASRATLLTLTSPVFAFGWAFVAFGSVPSAVDLTGGAVILTGIAVPLIAAAVVARRGADATIP